ncbi:serine/threonine-protein kinase [Streptomyces sp. DH24]|uniref:serine/threonine-protein kinase n=1 Tax=Streptomyces sp. DH24 TaxID=3040123 RepID=UPI00244255E4|nr:serine/threonine-protein kinase [Streptomyces sp. DH24]MDG9716884.1 serine/threonine-protein kinase [Streptomyces sp. DH24]
MQGLLLAGRYRLGDSIGSGGMGRVWRAHDEVLNRSVAVKELTAALYVSESDQGILLARTRAEARAAARINHSAVVTVHDVLEHDGRPWIVMELVEGRSLADAVTQEGRLEPREAARIGLWVLRALRAAHTAGVLHRDVKPGNVLLGHDGRVLLTDFGIAQIEGDTTITRTGEVVGSVDYLAPERVRGHDPGSASDLWALGATLYTAVEGRSPFRRTSPLSTMQAVVDEEPAETRYAGPLQPVITALLRKEPATRPDASATEQMLVEAAEGRRPNGAEAYVPTQYGGPGAAPATGAPYGPSYPSGSGAAYGATAGGVYGGTYGAAGGAGYGAATGPTRVGPPATGHGHTGRTAAGRRRLRTVALVVVLAALFGGGTAVVLQQWDEGRTTGNGTTESPTPSPSASTSPRPEGGVPASWVRRDDPAGFSLYLPKGWKRQVFDTAGGIRQIDYTPDGGEHFLRIAVDASPDFADPHAHQLDLEQQLQRLVDYRRVTLRENVYRDRPGSLWEYTWTAQAKDTPFPGPRRAIEETYVARDGTEYALYMSAPAADWPTARRQFTSVLQGWRPGTS